VYNHRDNRNRNEAPRTGQGALPAGVGQVYVRSHRIFGSAANGD
jgi:hypothetical protein